MAAAHAVASERKGSEGAGHQHSEAENADHQNIDIAMLILLLHEARLLSRGCNGERASGNRTSLGQQQ